MSVADWDVATSEVVALDNKSKNRSYLLTVGGRTMHDGMTFIWVRERFPVFVPDGMRYTIILDLGGIIPVYRKNMEKGGRGLGTFAPHSQRLPQKCGNYD